MISDDLAAGELTNDDINCISHMNLLKNYQFTLKNPIENTSILNDLKAATAAINGGKPLKDASVVHRSSIDSKCKYDETIFSCKTDAAEVGKKYNLPFKSQIYDELNDIINIEYDICSPSKVLRLNLLNTGHRRDLFDNRHGKTLTKDDVLDSSSLDCFNNNFIKKIGLSVDINNSKPLTTKMDKHFPYTDHTTTTTTADNIFGDIEQSKHTPFNFLREQNITKYNSGHSPFVCNRPNNITVDTVYDDLPKYNYLSSHSRIKRNVTRGKNKHSSVIMVNRPNETTVDQVFDDSSIFKYISPTSQHQQNITRRDNTNSPPVVVNRQNKTTVVDRVFNGSSKSKYVSPPPSEPKQNPQEPTMFAGLDKPYFTFHQQSTTSPFPTVKSDEEIDDRLPRAKPVLQQSPFTPAYVNRLAWVFGRPVQRNSPKSNIPLNDARPRKKWPYIR